jgi:uracil-DNA glycosylase family 4
MFMNNEDELFCKKIVQCTRCPRLVAWRERTACDKVRRFREDEYWGKPVPSFGPCDARFIIVGLAPAAHGANRTGRMFTGDRSGEWLYEQLFHFGFCTAPHSISIEDGMELIDTRITAVAHCAPPGNALLPGEIEACRSFFLEEIAFLKRKRVVLALGGVAYQSVSKYFVPEVPSSLPRFTHGAEYHTADGILVLASYHPSQQNTFTGKLTKEMFSGIFDRARKQIM